MKTDDKHEQALRNKLKAEGHIQLYKLTCNRCKHQWIEGDPTRPDLACPKCGY